MKIRFAVRVDIYRSFYLIYMYTSGINKVRKKNNFLPQTYMVLELEGFINPNDEI